MEFNKKVLETEAALLRGARKYMDRNGFSEVVVPHLTRGTGSCENVDTMFAIDWFGEGEVYLCQTGQLYLESLIPHAFDKVWCVGPSFRAEPRVDKRHLAEFVLLEFEFAGGFEELLTEIEATVKSMTKEAGLELKEPFARITYTRAINELGKPWAYDLKHDDEQYLVEMHGGGPLFITHYPEEIKFFNMRNNPENSRVVNSADLILPHSGEAVGAAERVYEYEMLHKKLSQSVMLKQLEARGGSIEAFRWYLDHMKNKGSVLHSGCGIGLNRVTQYVLAEHDIRNATTYPVNKETVF